MKKLFQKTLALSLMLLLSVSMWGATLPVDASQTKITGDQFFVYFTGDGGFSYAASQMSQYSCTNVNRVADKAGAYLYIILNNADASQARSYELTCDDGVNPRCAVITFAAGETTNPTITECSAGPVAPVAATWEAGDVNIAKDAPVFISARWGGDKAKAVDDVVNGDNIQLQVTGAQPTEWLVIDLGANFDIAKFSLSTTGDRKDKKFAICTAPAQASAPVFADGTDALSGVWKEEYVFDDEYANTGLTTLTYTVDWKNVRYIKYQATERNHSDQYGAAICEFRVKCDASKAVTGVSLDKTTASVPANKSLTLTATVTPADAANKSVNWIVSPAGVLNVVDGVITPITEGTATVTATTVDGNFTATCEVTVTAARPTEPAAAPEAPTYAADKVRALYSATYSTDCNHGAWGGSQSFTKEAYGIKIVLNPGNGYVGLVDFPARDCSTMEKFHADVWVEDNARMRLVPITGQAERGVFKDLVGGQWNSIEIALNEGDWAQTTDWSNVYQLKIDNAPNLTFWINNVYFYTTQDEDVTKPVMTSATLASASFTSAIINVAATDNRGVTKYIVKNGDAEVGKFVPADGKITVTGLTDGTAYTLSVYAQDAAENVSDNKVDVELTTLAMPDAAPAPVTTGKEAIAIYSDVVPVVVAHGFNRNTWGGAPASEVEKAGDHYLFYNTSATNWTAWGADNDGGDAIVGDGEVRGTKGGVNASGMEYLHIDIWSMQACPSFEVFINDSKLAGAALAATGWQSFDLPLSSYPAAPARDWGLDNVSWMKFVGINGVANIAIDNVYFWKASADAPKQVIATVNDAAMGTAVVKLSGEVVTEVEAGSNVDFIAEANDGYLFLGWYNGSTLVSTDATYTVEDVQAKVTLQAKFRALNNIYCHTELTSTAGDKHIFLTMKRTAENQYQVVIDSEEEMNGFGNAYIGGVNGGAGNQIQLNNADIMAQHVTISPDKHHITINVESTTPIRWNTPVYIMMPGEFAFSDPQNKTVEYEIACEAVAVESVTLNKTTANVAIDEQITLVATVAPLSAENRNVTWTSSNDAIASVENGVVTGVAEGEATITATSVADPTKSASCVVSVVVPYAKVCWNSGSDAGIALDYSFTYGLDKKVTIFMAPVHDKTGFNMQVNDGEWRTATAVEGGYTYSDGLDHEVGETMNGFFYMSFAGGAGRVDYHYTVGDECEKPVVHVTGMQISAEEQTMAVSETVALTANVLPLNADNKNLTWSSSNEDVATVNATTGLVTAVAQGTANIVATSEDGDFTATCVVTVVAGIEPTVYRAAGVFGGDPAVNMTYSITRNADRSLTFVVVLEDAIAGNKEINIGNGFEAMTYDAETLTATFTTETKYADGFKSSGWFFYFGGRRIDFKYEVGYETPEVRDDLVVNDFKGMCVDGDVDANNFVGAEFYEVEYKVGSEACVTSISLRQVTSLVGGKGYIVFATAPSLFCNFNGTLGKTATYDDSSDAIHVNRTNELEDVPENAGCFLLINNKLYECGTGCKVRPGSIYIRMAAVGTEPSAAPGRRRVIGNAQAPSTPTALDNISDDSNVEARKVVVDGNVFILRGNRVYNAMGQLVK